ncbi:hypothetical protein LCGC14_2216370, partial [marine sediment metagenome]
RDVIWGVKTISYGLEEDLVFINVNCHGRHWSCTFTKAELIRKMRSGLIELLAFENDSYSLTIKDIGKENKMKELDKPENDEKKETIKIPIKEGDLQDSTVSQLIKEKIEKDSKETVVGRKGCVDEGQTEPKEFTNNELMTVLENLTILNLKLTSKFDRLRDRIEWLQEFIIKCTKGKVLERTREKNRDVVDEIEKPIPQKEIEDKIKEIGNLFSDIVLLKMSEKE